MIKLTDKITDRLRELVPKYWDALDSLFKSDDVKISKEALKEAEKTIRHYCRNITTDLDTQQIINLDVFKQLPLNLQSKFKKTYILKS